MKLPRFSHNGNKYSRPLKDITELTVGEYYFAVDTKEIWFCLEKMDKAQYHEITKAAAHTSPHPWVYRLKSWGGHTCWLRDAEDRLVVLDTKNHIPKDIEELLKNKDQESLAKQKLKRIAQQVDGHRVRGRYK